jgi:DNA-binding NarL/FixJ family response regulator
MSEPSDAVLDAVRLALRGGDGAGARQLLDAHPDAASGAALECRARAAYLELDFRGTADLWERAYGAYRASGDQLGAVRVARSLAYVHGAVMGDGALMSGWLARAQTLLPGTADSSERGWVALNTGMFATDRAAKEAHFRTALDVARARADVDLELVALAYLGANLVHDDHVEEGMLLLDEALAGVAGNEADDFLVLEEVFCQLFSACEQALDVDRADQWIRVGDAIAARRKLPAVSAFCHTHYGGVLTAAGRWSEADVTLSEAVRMWGVERRGLRGGALVRLADLRVRQGRFEEAEQLLDGLTGHLEAARPLAAIHLARDEPALARDVLERALEQLDVTSSSAAPLLALLVDVHVALGAVDAAGHVADQLAACASRHPSDYLTAMAALARGSVCLATGIGDPHACLREALAGFDRARLPMELARTRLALANALATDRPEVAVAEARAALASFEEMRAARDADAASAVLRSLGAPGASRKRAGGVLTKREAEVLALLGHGLSNPEISDRLYISRKTVEHHVGSVLAKLGLRSRSEAAAYSARGGSEPE